MQGASEASSLHGPARSRPADAEHRSYAFPKASAPAAPAVRLKPSRQAL
jgi:hypothetical protein